MTTYSVTTIDDAIPELLRKEVWEYLQHLTYYAVRKDPKVVSNNPETRTIKYVPADNKKEYLSTSIPLVEHQYLHRTILGDDEVDLEEEHPVIFKLWQSINSSLNNQFSIKGSPEKIAGTYRSARVYVNALPSEDIKKSHTIHRDTINLEEDKNFTLLYIANLEWYPSWMGENVYYSDEDTGDQQSWQQGYGQSRGFSVGWPFKIVSPKPGRIILYDGRTLHTTKPTAIWAEQMRYAVAFRIKKTES